MSDNTSDNITQNEEPLLVDQLLDKLFEIQLDELDVEYEIIALNSNNEWRFFIIPITVFLLGAGMGIGLYLDSVIWGFLTGGALAFIVGYSYQLWDAQWQDIATKNVLVRIDALEGKQGFLRWFRPLLARNTYKAMFYKLYKQQVVDIELYARALQRLRDKPRPILRAALIATHPELAPPKNENNSTDSESES